ncbi:MAG: hypothetical protein ACR2H1_11060, partial [Limisphaerales bacterium]
MNQTSTLFAAAFTGSIQTFIVIGVVVVGLGLLIWLFSFLSIWIRATVSGAPVGPIELIALRLRGVPVGMI